MVYNAVCTMCRDTTFVRSPHKMKAGWLVKMYCHECFDITKGYLDSPYEVSPMEVL